MLINVYLYIIILIYNVEQMFDEYIMKLIYHYIPNKFLFIIEKYFD